MPRFSRLEGRGRSRSSSSSSSGDRYRKSSGNRNSSSKPDGGGKNLSPPRSTPHAEVKHREGSQSGGHRDSQRRSSPHHRSHSPSHHRSQERRHSPGRHPPERKPSPRRHDHHSSGGRRSPSGGRRSLDRHRSPPRRHHTPPRRSPPRGHRSPPGRRHSPPHRRHSSPGRRPSPGRRASPGKHPSSGGRRPSPPRSRGGKREHYHNVKHRSRSPVPSKMERTRSPPHHRPEHRVEHRPESRPEHRPEPRAEPRAEHRPEHRPEPGRRDHEQGHPANRGMTMAEMAVEKLRARDRDRDRERRRSMERHLPDRRERSRSPTDRRAGGGRSSGHEHDDHRSHPPPATNWDHIPPEESRDPVVDPVLSRYDEDHRATASKYGDQDDRETLKYQPPQPTMLNDRFTFNTMSSKPFVPKENISVGIERNIKGNEPAVIAAFNELEVYVPRRKNEGEKPLCSREEFEGPDEEYTERRVVKVHEEEGEHQRSITRQPKRDKIEGSHQEHGSRSTVRISGDKRENFEVRRDRFESGRPSLSERWQDSDSRKSDGHLRLERVIHRNEDFGRPVNQARSSDTHGDRDERFIADTRRIRNHSPGLGHGDRDERVVASDRRQISSGGTEYRRDEDLRLFKNKEKYVKDPGDLRHNLAKRRMGEESSVRRRLGDKRSGDSDYRRRTSKDGESRQESRTSELPNFSQREDKYKYAEWQDKPEMIPKSGYYFEHDNREDFPSYRGGYRGFRGSFRSRGRGRGSFRGFGRGRASFRGREIRGRRSGGVGGEWLHDKFREDEEADKEPSSTTEK